MRNLNKSYPLSHLAEHVGGKVVGDQTLPISGLCPLESPLPNHITFIRSESPDAVLRELSKVPTTTAVVVPANVAPLNANGETTSLPDGPSIIVVDESYPSFLNLIPLFFDEKTAPSGVHPTAFIDPTATLGQGASVGAHCYIGPHAKIGNNFTLHPHARIYEDVSIGDSVTLYGGVSVRNGTEIKDRVTIHDNSVIGADGFGYTPDPKVGLRKVPQLGIVQIESDVEIGASTCVDRGAFGPTIIGRGTKIDNLCQIGHNVILGSYCIVCAHCAIGGSTKIGDRVVLGGKVGLADHLTIASGVRIGGGSGILSSIEEPGDYVGFPGLKALDWRRVQVRLRQMIQTKAKK